MTREAQIGSVTKILIDNNVFVNIDDGGSYDPKQVSELAELIVDVAEKELLAAQKLAIFHDSIRRNVTGHLRWALDTMEMFKHRMPNDETLATACHAATVACGMSERLTDANS